MDECRNGYPFWSFFFLQSYLDGLIERYPELFEGGSIDGETPSIHTHNFGKKWGGYQSLVILANEDLTKFDEITQRPLEECLLYLSYKTDKTQLESLLHKEAMKKYKR